MAHPGLSQRRAPGASRGDTMPVASRALDDVDRRIVQLLQQDGRLPVNELASRANVSRATAYQRLGKLRSAGVIRGFTARIDHARLGLSISALLLIRVEQQAWREVVPLLRGLPGAHWLAVAAGEFDFALLVRVADVATLRDVVLDRLQAIPVVTATETVLLLEDHEALTGAGQSGTDPAPPSGEQAASG